MVLKQDGIHVFIFDTQASFVILASTTVQVALQLKGVREITTTVKGSRKASNLDHPDEFMNLDLHNTNPLP